MGKFKFDGIMLSIVFLLILGIVVSIFIALAKPTAVKGAYDAQLSYNVTDSNGVVHVIPADTTVDPLQTAKMFSLSQSLLWLLIGVAVLILAVIELMKIIKHE